MRNLFSRLFNADYRRAEKIIRILQNIKNLCDTQGAKYIVAITPMQWDNWLRTGITSILPIAIDVLEDSLEIEEIYADKSISLIERNKKALGVIMSNPGRGKFLLSLAAKELTILNPEMSEAHAAEIIDKLYKELYKK
jgi:hypothetical protein